MILMGTQPENAALPIDSVVKVIISDGGMSACIKITPPQNGGVAPNMDALLKALKENAIKDIDMVQLRSIELNPVFNEEIVVATGTMPINGDDGTADFLISMENRGKPKEVEGGSVDYYDLGIIENVYAGQPLCELTPPTAGTPGYTVKGELLKPKMGKAPPVIAGPNTELSQDGRQIIAKLDGQFMYDGKKISVNETYTLNQDVNTATGNIKVAGNLVVRGMVTSGFTIEAGGFINVVGVADSATIISGKDINLQGGATGSKITCGGDLKCRFIENCDVFVRGEMRAEYILNSNVRCKKSLKTEGVISKIIGGSIIVMQNVECRTIGTAAGVKTKLEIGDDPEIIDRQHELQEMIPELEKQIKSLEPLLKLLTQLEAASRLDDEKQQTLEKARYSHNTLSDTLAKAKTELEEINSSIFNKVYGKVVCTGIIYPGTHVTIGSASYTVTQNLMNTALFYYEGTVVFGAAR